MQLNLTPLADAGASVLPPDIVWLTVDGAPAAPGVLGVRGDFAVSMRPQDGAVGGLQAANPLASAVLMLLFSDMRAEDEDPAARSDGDRRGWPGDGFDVDTAAGEAPLGSKLWQFRRAALNDTTAATVAAEAKRALQPLVGQKAVVRIEAAATPDFENEALALSVDLIGRDGSSVYAARYDLIWSLADARL